MESKKPITEYSRVQVVGGPFEGLLGSVIGKASETTWYVKIQLGRGTPVVEVDDEDLVILQ